MTTAMATPPAAGANGRGWQCGNTKALQLQVLMAMLRMTTATATPPAAGPTDEDSDGDNTSGAKRTTAT